MPQRDHSGNKIVHRAHEDPAQGDPQECHGPVGCAEYGSEDGPEPRDIEQLNQENPPAGQRNIIHTVIQALTRGFSPMIDADQALQITAIGKVGRDKQAQTQQKSDHLWIIFPRR